MSTSMTHSQILSPPVPQPTPMVSARPNSGTTSPNPVPLTARFPVIYLTIEKRNSSPRVYNIPIESIDTWEKFLQILLHICPAEARALLISSDGPGGNKSYIIPSTWPNCLSPGREFLLQLGSCIKDPECPVCFKLNGNGSAIEALNQIDGGDVKKSPEAGGVTGEKRKELLQRGGNVGGKR